MRLSLRAAAIFVVLAYAVGCAEKDASLPVGQTDRPGPTTTSTPVESSPEPVDATVAASLKEEIRNVRQQIAMADAESANYTGGLVKALIASRVQTLKQTLVMLEQRDKAWTFGLRLQYTVDGKLFTLPVGAKEQLPEIERNLQELAAKIQAQDAEVGRYSGGLVRALSLSTLETMKQTDAMLNQRRLTIRYELPQFIAFQNSVPAPAGLGVTPAAAAPERVASGDDWEIVSIASRPGESNNSWTRFSWKLTISNKSSYSQKFDATIEFRDADGFPVDSDNEYNLSVPPGAQETFTGEKLISASQVSRIATTAAKVKKDL